MADLSHRQRPDPQKSLVGFVVGEVTYALDIRRVREIMNPGPVTPLPHTMPHVVGVTDHRDEVVPILDMRARFGLAPAPPSRSAKWILVDTGTLRVALLVDAVTGVFGTGGEDLRPAPSVGGSPAQRGILGVTTHGSGLAFVLDVARFVELADALLAQGVGADGP